MTPWWLVLEPHGGCEGVYLSPALGPLARFNGGMFFPQTSLGAEGLRKGRDEKAFSFPTLEPHSRWEQRTLKAVLGRKGEVVCQGLKHRVPRVLCPVHRRLVFR